MTWYFIVERAPWWGGFWEWMVQTVKKCLRKAIGQHYIGSTTDFVDRELRL